MPKKGHKMSKKVRVIQNRVQKGNKIPNVQQKCVKMTYHASKLAKKRRQKRLVMVPIFEFPTGQHPNVYPPPHPTPWGRSAPPHYVNIAIDPFIVDAAARLHRGGWGERGTLLLENHNFPLYVYTARMQLLRPYRALWGQAGTKKE